MRRSSMLPLVFVLLALLLLAADCELGTAEPSLEGLEATETVTAQPPTAEPFPSPTE